MSAYLIAVGIYIVVKAFQLMFPREMGDRLVPVIGLVGGVLDAMGGDGWGPIVTTSLVGRGHEPKKVIGSTGVTEFLVTSTISIVGVIAAPFGALVVKRLPVRPLMVGVAITIIATSIYRFF